METEKTLLQHYYSIIDQKQQPKYIQSKHKPITFSKKDTTKKLWEIHNKSLKNKKLIDKTPKQSLLDLKIEIATRMQKACHFCERKCHLDRTKQPGCCNVQQTQITSEFLHMGEEHVLIPSHTIFFSGCTFNCVFCQNWDISQKNCGIPITPKNVAKLLQKRNNQGSKNINWVGGDPTPHLPFILKTLKESDVNLPQIWNSNMYCTKETMNLLNGIIDVYLTDFKYGNDNCAKTLSNVGNYTEIIKRNHKIAQDTAEIIIRHLVLPNHIECCSKPILKWISENLPDALVNIMSQYRPEYRAYNYKEINRLLTPEEFLKIKNYAKKQKIHEI